jgi:hypothetical protein
MSPSASPAAHAPPSAQQRSRRLGLDVVWAEQVQYGQHAGVVVRLLERTGGAEPQLVLVRSRGVRGRHREVPGPLGRPARRLGRTHRRGERPVGLARECEVPGGLAVVLGEPGDAPVQDAALSIVQGRNRHLAEQAVPQLDAAPAGEHQVGIEQALDGGVAERVRTHRPTTERQQPERLAPGVVEPAQPGFQREAQRRRRFSGAGELVQQQRVSAGPRDELVLTAAAEIRT